MYVIYIYIYIYHNWDYSSLRKTIMTSNNFTEAVTLKAIQRKNAPKACSTSTEKYPCRRANPVKARRQ